MTRPGRGPAPVPVEDLCLGRGCAAVILRPLARPLRSQQAAAGESNYLHHWLRWGDGEYVCVCPIFSSEDILSISGESMILLDTTNTYNP